jgi:hypothetical protein
MLEDETYVGLRSCCVAAAEYVKKVIKFNTEKCK